LDDCSVPRKLKAWQYADYFPEDEKESAYQRLLQSLKMRNTKKLIRPNQRGAQVPFYKRQTAKISKLSTYQRIVIVVTSLLAIFLVGTLVVLLSFIQPQPTVTPSMTYTFPPYTPTKPINVPTMPPPTDIPVIELDYCDNDKRSEREVCINSFGVVYGETSDQLTITSNIKDQSIIDDLYIKVKRDDLSYLINFSCISVSVISNSDRIYCSGPFIKGGIKVMIYVLRFSNDQIIAQGMFIIPVFPPPTSTHITKTPPPFNPNLPLNPNPPTLTPPYPN